MASANRKLRILFIVLASVCMLLALLSLLFVLHFDRFFLTLLYKKLALLPDSLMYDNWLSPSLPIYFSVYFFNLTNADGFMKGDRPMFQEIGPFVYREGRERFDVNFSSEVLPRRVRYKHRIFYHFQPNMSVSSLDGLQAYAIDLYNAGMKAKGFSDHDEITKQNLNDLAWGYKPGLLQFANFFGLTSTDTVGLFATLNGTDVNEFVMDTGVDNIADIGKLYEYEGKTRLTLWDNDEANTIKGTDGSLARPGMREGAEFDVFVPSLCRSATSYAVGSTRATHRPDIELTVFSGSRPGQPENETDRTFCKSGFLCPPRGLITLEPCLDSKNTRVPIFLSQPRFLGADPAVKQPFDGLDEPDPQLHSTFIHIEPTTGIILEAFKNVQFNMLVQNFSSSRTFSEPVYWPMAWISETVVADRPTLDRLHRDLFRVQQLIPFVVSVVGAVLTVFAVGFVLALLVLPRVGSAAMGRRSRVNKARAAGGTAGATTSVSSPLSSSVSSSGDTQSRLVHKQQGSVGAWIGEKGDAGQRLIDGDSRA